MKMRKAIGWLLLSMPLIVLVVYYSFVIGFWEALAPALVIMFIFGCTVLGAKLAFDCLDTK